MVLEHILGLRRCKKEKVERALAARADFKKVFLKH